ncbi:CASP-like protein 4D1 [Sesamum alatum]|uniref:CASP-like protein n=1 Tax=Sesamum alatum TaxID=300844 RepID=A0AAE1Y4T5_9LAMI|nr:CASP-like protein 4D1 [Sesamum alatum]
MAHRSDQYDDEEGGIGSRFPVTVVGARVITLVSLIVSVVVLKTNTVTLDGYHVTYHDFRSYKFMFYVTIIGIVYTMLQIPFGVYYMRKRKHLIPNSAFLQACFYADKLMIVVLGLSAGAAFGATMDIKKYLGDNLPKLQDFLTVVYVPSAFLLLGCIACAVSSVHSSFALPR